MERRTLIKAFGAASLASTPVVRAAQEVRQPVMGAQLKLPDVTLFDGSVFKASEAQGQLLLIYWWASWCPFCAVTTPFVQKLWDAQRANGLKVLGLSIDRKAEDARQYMAQRGYTFPTGLNTPQIERVLLKPDKALPVTCARGRDGRVVMLELGQLFEEDVQQVTRFL